jgi:ATP-binding cassette subfamily B protein
VGRRPHAWGRRRRAAPRPHGPRTTRDALTDDNDAADAADAADPDDEPDFDQVDYIVQTFAEARQRKKDVRQFTTLVWASLKLVSGVGRADFLLSALLEATGGGAVLVQLLAGKAILTTVLVSGDHGEGGGLGRALGPVIAFIAATLVQRATSSLRMQRTAILGDLVKRRAMEQVLDVAEAVELEAFETPGFFNRLQRAKADGTSRPLNLVYGLLGLVGAVAATIGVAVALAVIEPVLLVFLTAAYLPLWFARRKVGRDTYQFYVAWTQNRRGRDYLESVLTGRDEAKEVRAFRLGPLLRSRWRTLCDEYMAGMRRYHRSRLRTTLLSGVLSSVLVVANVAFIVVLWQRGNMTLAAAGTALAGLQILGSQLEELATSSGSLYESALFLGEFHDFLELQRTVDARRPTATPPHGFERLTVDHLTFHYPGSDAPALDDVSISVDKGEIVALVGENGSGKTTLAKLLAGLYRPSDGAVRWDGVDVAECDPQLVRGAVAVIFQDFVRYKLSARENIGVGSSDCLDDDAAIERAARLAGAHGFLSALPRGYDTILSKEFKGGRDLSVGQWQRVALARALLRDAPFVVLDEPTAALDPRAESDLFESLHGVLRGRTALLISHRFSSVRSADRIFVLDKGRVVEQGTHAELMARRGLYAELFTLQAEAYLDGTLTPTPTPTTTSG